MDEIVNQKADRFIAYMVDSGNKSDPETIREAIKYGIRIGFDIFKDQISQEVKKMEL